MSQFSFLQPVGFSFPPQTPEYSFDVPAGGGPKQRKRIGGEYIIDMIVESLSSVGFLRNKSSYVSRDIMNSGMPLQYIQMPYEFPPGQFVITNEIPKDGIEIVSPGGDTMMDIKAAKNKIVDLSNHSLSALGSRTWAQYIMIFPQSIDDDDINVYCRMPLVIGNRDNDCKISKIVTMTKNYVSIKFKSPEDMIGSLWKNCHGSGLSQHFKDIIESVEMGGMRESLLNYQKKIYVGALMQNTTSMVYQLKVVLAEFMMNMYRDGPFEIINMSDAILKLLPSRGHIPQISLARSIGGNMFRFVFGGGGNGKNATREEYYKKAGDIICMKQHVSLFPQLLDVR